MRRFRILNPWAVVVGTLIILAGSAHAQTPGGANPSPPPPLSAPQKNTLFLIAQEALDAAREGRPPRTPTVEERLNQAQPMVVSLYLGGQLRARAWKLSKLGSLSVEVSNLTKEALANPKVTDQPFPMEDIAASQIRVSVLSNFKKVKDETEIPPNSAIIIINGFTEWLGLPGDIPSNLASDLLSHICQQAGLRPNVWLLPQTDIYVAQVEE